MRAAAVADFRELARRRLPHMLFEYIDGGAYSEVTLRRNVDDFETLSLRQRVMRDMSQLNLSTRVLGQDFAMPVGLAPVGLAGMYARRGERQGARAAAKAGVPFCLSSMGVCDVNEVAQTGVAPWFQLYVLKDRGYTRALIQRARDAGSPVLVVTVDLPVGGSRYRDLRSGFVGGSGLRKALDGLAHPQWMYDVWLKGRPHTLGSMTAAFAEGQTGAEFVGGNFDRSLTWADLDWVREVWDGPIVVKGVLDADDARAAVRAGAQGIVVSNHGGRQLDSVSSTIGALRGVVDAVGADCAVLLDGGVRSGLDVLKALAVGAKACFVGRPWAFALAAGGEQEVTRMLQIIRAELEVAMVLTGCNDVAEAGRALIDGEF